MLSEEERKEAKRLANVYAPEPPLTPPEATIRVLLIVGCGIGFFSGLAGLDLDGFGIPLIITLAIAGGGTYFYFRQIEDKHYNALHQEEQSIKQKREGNK